jgi:hypothetical protein
MFENYTLGYLLAGIYNFSILVFCKLFSNNLGRYDSLFNFNGIIMILLWGMSYISISRSYRKEPFLNLVFFIEKMYFVYKWVIWMLNNHKNLSNLFNEDIFTGLFYSVYGIGDLLFGLFFLSMALTSLLGYNREKNEEKKKFVELEEI